MYRSWGSNQKYLRNYMDALPLHHFSPLIVAKDDKLTPSTSTSRLHSHRKGGKS